MIQKLLNVVNDIKSIIRKRKLRKNLNNIDTNTVYVDFGSSALKIGYKNELFTCRSSVRKIYNIDEVSISDNYINVNGQWFAVAENIPCGNYEYKYQKEHKEVLILFGLMKLKEKVRIDENIKVSILLPLNELKYKEKFFDINGEYEVSNTKGQTMNVNLMFSNKVSIEGEASKYYIEKMYDIKNINTVIVNVGNKTTDISIYNSSNNRESVSSINIGGNYLLSKMLKYTKAPTSSILNTWIVDNYKFNSEEESNISEVKREFINLLWNDIYNSSIATSNPQNTVCYLVGGTSNLISKEIKSNITNGVNVKTLSKEENLYSDILGAMLINKDFKININSFDDDKEPDAIIPEVKKENTKVKCKISNYDRYKELSKKGYSTEEIANIMELSKQTIFNYKSKYKKELKEAEKEILDNQLKLAI